MGKRKGEKGKRREGKGVQGRKREGRVVGGTWGSRLFSVPDEGRG